MVRGAAGACCGGRRARQTSSAFQAVRYECRGKAFEHAATNVLAAPSPLRPWSSSKRSMIFSASSASKSSSLIVPSTRPRFCSSSAKFNKADS